MMEKEIVYLENLVAVKESEINKLRAAIQVLRGTDAVATVNQEAKLSVVDNTPKSTKTKETVAVSKAPVKVAKRRKYKKRKKKTIKDIILQALKDSKPKTKLEILDYVKKAKGEGYKSSSLGPLLSNLMKTHLRKTTISGDQTSNKYYYGLNEWFEDGALKSEYIDNLYIDEK